MMDYRVLLDKAKSFCAYRERCISEVRDKMYALGIDDKMTIDRILRDLTKEGFLNEERFARTYVRGKFRINKWGKLKIVLCLRNKNIEDSIIRNSLREEISDEEYLKTAIAHIRKNISSLHDKPKLLRILQTKGFEYDICNKAIRSIKVER